MMEPFDFYGKVMDEPTSYVLIPIEQVILPSSLEILKREWSSIIGTKIPKCLAYLIYDRKSKIPFKGTTQSICTLKYLFLFRQGSLCYQFYSSLWNRTSRWKSVPCYTQGKLYKKFYIDKCPRNHQAYSKSSMYPAVACTRLVFKLNLFQSRLNFYFQIKLEKKRRQRSLIRLRCV